MIRNFEEYTSEMTEDEINYIIPRLIKMLTLAIGKGNALTNRKIVYDINIRNAVTKPDPSGEYRKQVTTSEPRIRHMIHILRVSDAIPCLIATSAGYYISNDRQEIETYMGSIDDRLRSIYQIRRALKRQLKDWGSHVSAVQRELIF